MDDGDNSFLQNKKKRKRTAPDQLKVLEDIFSGHQHPNLLLRNQLAVQLGMTPRSVQIWFQNRRAKARNMEFTSSTLNSGSPGGSPHSPSHSPSHDSATTLEESVYQAMYLSTSMTHSNEEPEEVRIFWMRFLQSQYPQLAQIESPSQDKAVASTSDNSIEGDAPTKEATAVVKFDVNSRDSNGLSLLFISSVLGYEAQVKKLVESGADVSILMVTVINLFKKYINENKTIDSRDITDNSGNTALAAASLLGHTAIVSYLLSQRADCNLSNGEGYTPLYLACKGGYIDIVLLLIKAGAEVNVRTEEEGDTSLHITCLKGHDEISYTFLLQHGATPNVCDKHNFTPLHHACIKGHLNIATMLLRTNHIDVNAKDTKKHTALHAAALMGFDQVVTCLIDHKADLDAQDVEGYLLLTEGREGVVKLLIRAGADLNIKSNAKLSVIHIAARWSSVQMCSLLIDSNKCKSIDDENVHGMRPLHFAALTGKVNFMRYLIEKGANPVVNDIILNGEPVTKLPDCDMPLISPNASANTEAGDSHEASSVTNDVK